MELHREDVSLLDRAKIQSEVMVPLIRAMERELGAERSHVIVRDALATEFRAMAQRWVQDADGDTMAAFATYSDYSTRGDPLEVEPRSGPRNELRFDVVRCDYARFFQELAFSPASTPALVEQSMAPLHAIRHSVMASDWQACSTFDLSQAVENIACPTFLAGRSNPRSAES